MNVTKNNSNNQEMNLSNKKSIDEDQGSRNRQLKSDRLEERKKAEHSIETARLLICFYGQAYG